MWAGEPQQALKYLDAIRGTRSSQQGTAEPLVWGWGRIAQYTTRGKQFRDAFHEARYNSALCHYKLALRLRKATDRTEYLNRARNEIVVTQRMFPNMGGPTWYSRYDALLKKIQRSLGERAEGLASAEKK